MRLGKVDVSMLDVKGKDNKYKHRLNLHSELTCAWGACSDPACSVATSMPLKFCVNNGSVDSERATRLGGDKCAEVRCSVGLVGIGWCKICPFSAEATMPSLELLFRMAMGLVLGGESIGVGEATGVLQRDVSSGKLQLAGLRRDEDRETERETGSGVCPRWGWRLRV